MGPLRFAFGVHIHQPVGNFDHVVEQHVREAYRPLLERLSAGGFTPFSLHISGPLLEWLETHDAAFIDLVGRLAADRKIELLLSGYDEPILCSLPRADRVEQIGWMRDAVVRLFGAGAENGGLWLTERVWEPDLAGDLAAAGVRYALVDDRHFLEAGFPRKRLHAPYWTEGGGRPVALLSIDERLRYLVPFKPPTEILGYLEKLRGAGHRLAVLADDGEKFGGWPGTREWVFERGWLSQFLEVVAGAVGRGELKLVTCSEALAEVPSGGIAYLPSASYSEMERWALPPDAARHLAHLERELGEHRLAGPEGALVRGTHWRSFLARYPESNRMHKKMLALSVLHRSQDKGPGRRAADLAEARRAIGRAQCNDAYWHGVFGGLYLPHLRGALWHNLALAERLLRHGQKLEVERLDLDLDGREEIWVHSDRCSVVIAPARGGAVEEYTLFATLTNYADVLTRRPEAYHDSGDPHGEHPPYDADERALFVDRVLPGELALDAYAAARYAPLASWARTEMRCRVEPGADAVEIVLEAPAGGLPLEKRIRIGAGGALAVTYRWDAAALPPGGRFAPELSLGTPLEPAVEPAAELWRFAIETVAKSERGLERTKQGESITPLVPVAAGTARIAIEPPSA
ncbi:MAG TPA: alpha-amylase/4-alpha-glucanotransferase domain-containing protein [Gemmatimonadales bacterium]|nr:alpha-amylase/4-alpha-glucanotransferase domain-containing protein [Gemmatimonadales bacterium]